MRLVNGSTFTQMNPALGKKLSPCKCGCEELRLLTKSFPEPSGYLFCPSCKTVGPEADSVDDAIRRWKAMQLIS